MAVAIKEKKKSEKETSLEQNLVTLGLPDYELASFKTRAFQLMDLTSLYRLRFVAEKHFRNDSASRDNVLRIIDQRINSL